jgi:hypothetical protein
MLKTMRITETRKRLTSLHDDLRSNETAAVTNRGEKILAIMGDRRLTGRSCTGYPSP